MYKCRRIF